MSDREFFRNVGYFSGGAMYAEWRWHAEPFWQSVGIWLALWFGTFVVGWLASRVNAWGKAQVPRVLAWLRRPLLW